MALCSLKHSNTYIMDIEFCQQQVTLFPLASPCHSLFQVSGTLVGQPFNTKTKSESSGKSA